MISDKHLFNGSLFVLIFTGVTVAWGEAIGLTLFISHLGVRALPPGIIIEALLSMIFIFSFEQLKGVVHDAILVVVLCVTGIGLLLFGKELVQIGSDLGFGLYYATQRIMRDVLLLYVWNYVTSYYESHTRYLLSRLMWMTRIGVVIGGLVLVVLSLFFSVRDLVWIWGGALLVCGLSIGVFADEFQSIHHIEDRSVRSSSAVSIRFASALRSFFGSPMMRLASISAFCMMLILSVIYFRAAEVFWDNFSTELSFLRWLAVIGSLFNLLVLPVQYILLPAIARSRYRKTITDIYPIFTGLAFVSVMSVPVLLTASIADFARSSLQISLYDVTQNQMKNTLPGSIRFWAHTFLDGIVEPVGRVVGGVVLVFMVTEAIPVEPVFVIGAVLAVIFIYTENRAKSLFEESVNASLSAGQYGFLRKSLQEQQVTTDQEIVNQLLERIKNIDPDDREVLLIAEALAETHSEAGFESLLGLWPRCSSSQQAELLLLLTEGWPDQRTGEAIKVVVAEALESEETKLRRAALKAMAIYPHLLDTFRVAQYLIDSDPTVNTTAGQLLLQHPSHQLARAAEAQLGWLSKASSSSTRAMAVTAMVNGGVNRFGERVVPIDVQRFQNDRSARVRMSVVPATDYKELIYSACDESPSVRRLAVQRLRRRRRLSTRLLTEHTAKTRRDTPEDFQIYETIRYWHLLTALGKVSSKTEREFLFRELKLGINQIDYISALRHTLKHLQYPPLTPIMTQLSNDRSQLVQAMVNFIGAVFGSDNIDAIVRTIQMEPDKKSNEAASVTLSELLTPEIAVQLITALTSPRDEIPFLNNHPAWQPDDPVKVIRVLLAQNHEWFPMLSLYALTALPRNIFQTLTDFEQVEAILEIGRRSQDDAVREGTRLLKQALREDTGTASRATSILTRITSTEREDDLKMLSTIERMLFLRNVTFFENLRLDQLRTLARICEELSVNEGEYVIRKGEAGDSLYIIVEGKMNIYDRDASDKAIITRNPGDVLGEISLFDGGLRSADAVAATPSLLLVVYRDMLDNALADDPGIALDMLRAMAQLIRRSNQNLARLTRQLNPDELTD